MNRKTIAIAVSLISILTIAISYLLVNSGNFGVIHDLAITDVEPSKTQLYVGETVDINVVAKNKGNVNESFNVTSFYNTTEIGTETITNLAPNSETSVMFSWNTSKAAPGNFIIKAKISAVPSEANISDNSLSDGLVMLRERPSQTAVIYVDPQTSTAQVNQEFMINISITNVTDLYAWELRLSYNSSVLNLTGITEKSFLKNVGSTLFTYKKSPAGNTVVADCTLLGQVSGASGSGTLATLNFHVEGFGTSPIDLFNSTLVSSFESDIDHTVISGIFNPVP